MLPHARVELVRAGVLSIEAAYATCLGYRPDHCGHWLALLPELRPAQVLALVEHTRSSWWRSFTPIEHPGLWVSRRAGGESLSAALVERLLALGEVALACELFAELQHLGARIEALGHLQPHLSTEVFEAARAETLARVRELDPIRRHYALCELSRLFPPEQALALVDEAIAGLPVGHRWAHFPGGLMLMSLAEPVIEALDRDGLRPALRAWAEREGEGVWDNLFGTHEDRLAAALGRLRPEPDDDDHDGAT